ncbi:MAG: hypothetical protein RLZZ350_606 [Verrucomicrobiota bacterium]|jgi:CspA family cold shock protein
MASGKVKWFNEKKGFGFITDEGGQELFVHHSAIIATGYRLLVEGEPVTYEIVASEKGHKAEHVVRAPK